MSCFFGKRRDRNTAAPHAAQSQAPSNSSGTPASYLYGQSSATPSGELPPPPSYEQATGLSGAPRSVVVNGVLYYRPEDMPGTSRPYTGDNHSSNEPIHSPYAEVGKFASRSTSSDLLPAHDPPESYGDEPVRLSLWSQGTVDAFEDGIEAWVKAESAFSKTDHTIATREQYPPSSHDWDPSRPTLGTLFDQRSKQKEELVEASAYIHPMLTWAKKAETGYTFDKISDLTKKVRPARSSNAESRIKSMWDNNAQNLASAKPWERKTHYWKLLDI